MTPISTEIQKQFSDKLSKQIAKILNSPDLRKLTDEQLEKLAKSLVIDNLKDQLKIEVKKATINIENLKSNWLSTFNSGITKLNYRHNIEEFLKWLENKSIIDFRAIDADDYLQYLKNSNISAGTIRFRIASVSSFCNYLKRLDVIPNNYFLKIKGLPKIKETQKIIPNDKDIQVIEEELLKELNATGRGSSGKIKASRILLVALGIIKNHALRIGALESLSIDRQGKFIADSKGNTVRGFLNEESKSLIEKLNLNANKPFAGYKTASIKKQFERFLTRLHKDGKIEKIFSPHDFRHYSAVKFYKESLDIFATMKFLNHKNVTTTQIYLRGLGVIDEKNK